MTDRKTDKKKETSKIKTFPIPFALDEINGTITINTNTSNQTIINQGLKLHSEGKISEAAKYYKYYIEQGLNNHIVFANYGSILNSLGKPKEAEYSYRKSIQIKPDFALAHYNLANTLRSLGKLEEAELYTRIAIKFNPDLAEAHYNLGNTLKSLGKLEEAELSLRRAIKIKSDFSEAHSNLANTLRELGKLKEAESSIRKAIEINPNSAIAYSNLGGILRDLGKLKEAELSTRKSIEINPNLAQSHIILGEILFDLGEIEESRLSDYNGIKILTSSRYLISYRENAKLIKKIAFWVHSCSIFNQFQPVIDINPESFEILVPNNVDKKIIHKIRNNLKTENIIIRSINELLENNLIYEKLISNRGDDKFEPDIKTNSFQSKPFIPTIKLFGKLNIRFMYTAGKNKYTISSYWNKYYDGILCYGPYHEDKFKLRHKISTSQMGYPRFDKYFKPGFKREILIEKFKCDPQKETIVWLPTWTNLSSIDKYHKEISSLRKDHNIVVRPHPTMRSKDPGIYKKLFTVDFNYIDEKNEDDNVQLYALADLMLFDYGGPMFGALYLKKNFAFLDMKLESKNNNYLGESSSEDYLKSFFPERIAKAENLKSICNYCLKNPPSNSIVESIREEFFNTSYPGNSAKRAYELLISNNWLK